MVIITLLSIEGEPVDVIGRRSASDPDNVVAGQWDCLLLHLRAIGQCGDGGDQDGDGGVNCVFQRGRAEPRDPDQEITKSERLHW